MEATERCIGCGAMVPRMDGPIHRYMTSAPGCWAKHCTSLTPPSFDGAHTVLFMASNLQDAEWAAREWATSAWMAWAAHHPQVRAWYDDLSKAFGRHSA